jgi:hypothetical protein
MNPIVEAQDGLHDARLAYNAATVALEEAWHQVAKAERLTQEWVASHPADAGKPGRPSFLDPTQPGGLTSTRRTPDLPMPAPPSPDRFPELEAQVAETAAALETAEAAMAAAREKGYKPEAVKLAPGDMTAGKPMPLFGVHYERGDRVPREVVDRLDVRRRRVLVEQGRLR